MDFWFNQLSRMEYGAEFISTFQKTEPKFVDSISFGISFSGQEGCISEAKIVWLQIESNAAPFPHIEIFSDGITAAYSNEFINALMMLKDKGDFTPAECTEALIACGFTDTSSRKMPKENKDNFNLASEIYKFLTKKGFPCYIKDVWYENNELVIQNIGTKIGKLSVKSSLVDIYKFAEKHAQPFIPQLAAISSSVYLGLDDVYDGALTGTWTYRVYLLEHNDDRKVFEDIKKRFEKNANAKIIATHDYKSYNGGDFRVHIIANNYRTEADGDAIVENEVTEWCAHCGNEHTLFCIPEKDGYIAVCNNCHGLLFLCSECPNASGGCDWTEKEGCCKCTPRNFLDFLANRYKGVTGKNTYGEYFASFPLPSGRSVNVTYETKGLKKSETFYDIEVFCSEAESETEQYKDNPVIALTNSYKSMNNVFKMTETLFETRDKEETH